MEEMILNILGDLLYGAVLFVLGAAAQFVRSERRNRRAIENGMCALLRNNIILIHDDVMSRGSIPATQYENVKKMSEAYKELGGNGLIKKMMQEIEELNTKTISREA